MMVRPALHALRAALPTARVHVAARAHLLELFSDVVSESQAESLRPLPEKMDLRAVWSVASAWRQQRYDAALLLAPSLRAGLEATAAQIPLRLGYADDHRGWTLTHPVYRPARRRSYARVPFAAHCAEEHAILVRTLLKALGAEGVDSVQIFPQVLPEMPLPASEQSCQKVLETLPRPWIGLHPFSHGGETRSWPLERYQQLAERLWQTLGATIVLHGGPDSVQPRRRWGGQRSRGQAEELETFVAHHPGPVVVRAGATALTLGALAEWTRTEDCFVVGDTGPMHLAAAAGAKMVVLFGSTDPALTGPLELKWPGHSIRVLHQAPAHCMGCYRNLCPTQLECMHALSVEKVFAAVVDSIEERDPSLELRTGANVHV